MTEIQTETQAEPATKSWLLGFKDIFFMPGKIIRHAPFPVGKVAATALLMYVISAILSAYITDSSQALRNENYRLRARPIEMAQQSGKLPKSKAEAQLSDMKQNYRFVLSTALTATLPIGAIWLLATTAIIWLIQNFLLKDSLTFTYTLAFVSFGNAIDAAGNLFKTFLHYIAGTLWVDPSLAAFTNTHDHPFLFAFLSRVDVFIIWQYAAVALAICAYANADRRKAYLLAAVVITIILLYFGAGAYYGASLVA